MAIRDIQAFAHRTADDIESLDHELDRIRTDIEKSLGPRDAAYIRRVFAFQRGLETPARLMLLRGARYRGTWIAGSVMPAWSKIIEMMVAGHNIGHGRWDRMNDPEIQSANREWDFAGPSAHWKRAHNHIHHTYTTASLPAQFWLSSRTLWKLALPDRFLRSTSDDAAETRSERKFLDFALLGGRPPGGQPTYSVTGTRRGLRNALAATASKRGSAPGSGHRFQRWIGAFTGERGRQ
ncbi:hypothetical protein [Nocardia rhamnosiphila]|uniref:Fatty acid desaturase n=1 Tax=Nocardia rhamnosiphila TaxID=426716 RepID=A0ABV2WK49_9NOCA